MGHLDQHAGGARIKRVLDQFLYGGGGALHDLAGRDPVDRGFIQLADDGAAYFGVIKRHTPKPSMCA